MHKHSRSDGFVFRIYVVTIVAKTNKESYEEYFPLPSLATLDLLLRSPRPSASIHSISSAMKWIQTTESWLLGQGLWPREEEERIPCVVKAFMYSCPLFLRVLWFNIARIKALRRSHFKRAKIREEYNKQASARAIGHHRNALSSDRALKKRKKERRRNFYVGQTNKTECALPNENHTEERKMGQYSRRFEHK